MREVARHRARDALPRAPGSSPSAATQAGLVSDGARTHSLGMSAFLARVLALLLVAGSLSSCLVTGLATTHYFYASGALDHDARVEAAWRGPEGELALALEELEGVYRREEALLVFTAEELEQMFSGQPSTSALVLPVAHIPMPRSILTRGLTLARPAPGSSDFVPVASWNWIHVEGDERRTVLPEPPPEGVSMSVHWTHQYRSGASAETGFALLLTRRGEQGLEHALVLPAPFEPPKWPNALLALTLMLDVGLWLLLLS